MQACNPGTTTNGVTGAASEASCIPGSTPGGQPPVVPPPGPLPPPSPPAPVPPPVVPPTPAPAPPPPTPAPPVGGAVVPTSEHMPRHLCCSARTALYCRGVCDSSPCSVGPAHSPLAGTKASLPWRHCQRRLPHTPTPFPANPPSPTLPLPSPPTPSSPTQPRHPACPQTLSIDTPAPHPPGPLTLCLPADPACPKALTIDTKPAVIRVPEIPNGILAVQINKPVSWACQSAQRGGGGGGAGSWVYQVPRGGGHQCRGSSAVVGPLQDERMGTHPS